MVQKFKLKQDMNMNISFKNIFFPIKLMRVQIKRINIVAMKPRDIIQLETPNGIYPGNIFGLTLLAELANKSVVVTASPVNVTL